VYDESAEDDLDPHLNSGLNAELRAELSPDGAPRLGSVVLRPDMDETVLLLAGDVDLSLSGDLDEACREAIARARPIRLDVSSVSFIDSTAIGYVVTVAAAERDQGRTLVISGASRRTADTLRLTGLGELLGLD
jgi:anti-sigma B factor antagonist